MSAGEEADLEPTAGESRALVTPGGIWRRRGAGIVRRHEAQQVGRMVAGGGECCGWHGWGEGERGKRGEVGWGGELDGRKA